MKGEAERKLRVFTQELNDLLNHLYEASKTHEKASRLLVFKNACIYLFQILLTFLSWKGFLISLIPVGILTLFREGLEPIGNLPLQSIILLIATVLISIGAWIRILVLEEMSRIGSPFFHLAVYEKRRKKEYMSLIALSKEKDFIYTLSKEFQRELQNDNTEQLREELVKQEEVLKENNEAIIDLLEKLTASEELAELFNERSDQAINFLFSLKNKLNMLVQGQFNLDNISFGVNYSLYKVEDSGRYFIEGYGINKAEFDVFIPLEKGNNKYIQSIHTSHITPLVLDDFISWKRILQDGEEWVISLHLDESNRTKLNYAEDTGKLNVSLIQELLWICCELLNRFQAKRRDH